MSPVSQRVESAFKLSNVRLSLPPKKEPDLPPHEQDNVNNVIKNIMVTAAFLIINLSFECFL